MPRSGYDLTRAAEGSPAAEAAARARLRRAAGNITPRAGTPRVAIRENVPNEDDQATPRASRIGVGIGTGSRTETRTETVSVQPPMDPQMSWPSHSFQGQAAGTAPELIQNPLNFNAGQNNLSMVGAANALYGYEAAPTATMSNFTFGTASTFGQGVTYPSMPSFRPNPPVFQQNQFPAWNNNQPGAAGQDSVYPDPEAFSLTSPVLTMNSQPSAPIANPLRQASGNAGEGVEMSDSETSPTISRKRRHHDMNR